MGLDVYIIDEYTENVSMGEDLYYARKVWGLIERAQSGIGVVEVNDHVWQLLPEYFDFLLEEGVPHMITLAYSHYSRLADGSALSPAEVDEVMRFEEWWNQHAEIPQLGYDWDAHALLQLYEVLPRILTLLHTQPLYLYGSW